MNEKGYKAYNPGLICRGHKYEEDTVYKKNGHGICCSGVTHYCVNPFDTLDYYPLVQPDGQFSEFTTVEAIDEPATDDWRKFATSTIKIGFKLGFKGFIQACVDFLYEKTTKEMPKPEDVDVSYGAQIGSSGRYAQIGSSGDDAKITVENVNNVVACVGKRGRIKAPVGTWCTLAEYGEWNGEGCPCICVKSFEIDGETYKADTWYTLKDGEIVEVPEE